MYKKQKDFFGFNKAINWNKLKNPKVLKELEKIFEEEKTNKRQATSERANREDNMKKYENYVVITDDKGKKQAFYNFHELIKYLDSFKMSFLPDNFTYTIHEE